MRVLVFGANGQLGLELARVLPPDATLAPRAAVDVCDAGAVAAAVADCRPDVVVNCAADNRVDALEAEPDAAFATNAEGAEHVAAAAAGAGALVVHTSTDYVFGAGRTPVRPWVESDEPAPHGVYARSKAAGEQRVIATAPRAVIVRLSGLYAAGGARAKGGSFVDRVLARARAGERLRVVADQTASPTWARDAAAAIALALPRWCAVGAPLGVYHVANAGACSWWELARAALALAGVAAEVEPVDTAAFGAPAPRPAYSALASERLAALGVPPLRPWRAALAAYLAGGG